MQNYREERTDTVVRSFQHFQAMAGDGPSAYNPSTAADDPGADRLTF